MSLTVRTVFITLFIVIITVFALSAWLVFLYPSSGHVIVSRIDNNKSTARLQVSTQKIELEKIINNYVREYVRSDGLSFSVTLDHDLQFHGNIRMLGFKVPVSIGFDPIVQDNGDLVLVQQYFQVGAVSLPATVVLEYVNRSYTFPEWIVLQPAQKKIYLATTNMDSGNGVHIQVEKFDLIQDELMFDVILSTEGP